MTDSGGLSSTESRSQLHPHALHNAEVFQKIVARLPYSDLNLLSLSEVVVVVAVAVVAVVAHSIPSS